jgi:hypothetical protein
MATMSLSNNNNNPTNTATANKDTVYIDYLNKFRKEASYFEVERTANGKPWPRAKSPTEIAYHNFLAEVVDPSTGDYYFIIQNDQKVTAKYVIDRIVREKHSNGNEYLYSEGYIEAFDYFKDNKRFRCSKPEVHTKTNFEHRKRLNPKNQIERVTLGPKGSETIYEMKFTPENADLLWQKRRDGNISLVLKDQMTGQPRLLERKGSISADDYEGAFQLFKTAPFQYLYNWDYMKGMPSTITATQPDTTKTTTVNKSNNPEKVK